MLPTLPLPVSESAVAVETVDGVQLQPEKFNPPLSKSKQTQTAECVQSVLGEEDGGRRTGDGGRFLWFNTLIITSSSHTQVQTIIMTTHLFI